MKRIFLALTMLLTAGLLVEQFLNRKRIAAFREQTIRTDKKFFNL
ncbi:hypothetical protein YK48G_16650 [Lentilactobacillus fungorum]|uniref:Uncharacterized protein n=1 Tax=Lentilactobacillus fungorum TaxID=2201250 RepID=A0ABQ3VZA7_9LACO|nr:hypothetical protein [Lentilactobacillus fungorum]GHP14240.1 hypothetical protein YK48G_16650 [Lentilactobacillus fungorum]